MQTFDFHFKSRHVFPKKGTTIFSVPLALQSEVTVVLIYVHGEQIYLANFLRYYFLLLQKHPAESFTLSPFHTVFIIGHYKKKNPTSP